MRLPGFFQKPEQMVLLPVGKIPLHTRLWSWLKRSPFPILIVATVPYVVGSVKALFIFEVFYHETMRRTDKQFTEVWRDYAGDEFLWFLWLVVTLVLLLAWRRLPKGEGTRPYAMGPAILLALFIYVFEVSGATIRLIYTPTTGGVPWSFYALGVGLIILLFLKLPAIQLAPWKNKLEVKDYLSLMNSTRTILLQVVAGVIVISGLYYTSQNLGISQENVRLALLKEDADRLNQAITQLKDENPEVRLVAIHNLQPLATRSLDNYRLMTNLFARYIRAHATWKDGLEQISPEDVESHDGVQSILSFITNLDEAATAIKTESYVRPFLEPGKEKIVAGNLAPKLDLRATDLRGLWLYEPHMRGWKLMSAHLEKTWVVGGNLREAVLDNANMSDSKMTACDFDSASLKNAKLNRADLQLASFNGADIEGADFSDAINLTGYQIRKAKNYDKAKLSFAVLIELEKASKE